MNKPLTEVETQKESWEEQKRLREFNDKYWWDIKKRFTEKFVRGHGPISNGDNYPQEAESWVEADEEQLLSFIYLELQQALLSDRARIVEEIESLPSRAIKIYKNAGDLDDGFQGVRHDVSRESVISIIKESR